MRTIYFYEDRFSLSDKTRVDNFISELEARNVTVIADAERNGYNFNMTVGENNWVIRDGQTIYTMFVVDDDGTITMYFNVLGPIPSLFNFWE